jgi:hypothetical protein
MCDNVDVRTNEVYESVAGIEIENSRHCLVEYILIGPPCSKYNSIIKRNFQREKSFCYVQVITI